MAKKQHYCEKLYDSTQCGPAVTYCFTLMSEPGEPNDDVGSMFAGNGRYESMVNFCPFCGKKAKRPAVNTAPPGGKK